jgi:hypothetical protein
MATTPRTTPAVHRDQAPWHATLWVSLAAVLAVVLPHGGPQRRACPGPTAWAPDGVPAHAASPCLMLVASDVCPHSGGLVP